MLPVEELGLFSRAASDRVRAAARVPTRLAEVYGRLCMEGEACRLVNLTDGVAEPVHLLLLPLVARPGPIAYVQSICLVVLDAARRIAIVRRRAA